MADKYYCAGNLCNASVDPVDLLWTYCSNSAVGELKQSIV